MGDWNYRNRLSVCTGLSSANHMVGRQVFSLSSRVLISSLQTQEHRKLYLLNISGLNLNCKRYQLIHLFLIINLFLLAYQPIINLLSLYFYFQRFRYVTNSLELSVIQLVTGLQFSLIPQLKSSPILLAELLLLNVGALVLVSEQWLLNRLNAIVLQLNAIILRPAVIIILFLFYFYDV
jgi:hypothetical protein